MPETAAMSWPTVLVFKRALVTPEAVRVVALNEVVVAEVPVAVLKVNACRVVLPKASESPVVVAPPKIVKPLAVVLLPTVEEARE